MTTTTTRKAPAKPAAPKPVAPKPQAAKAPAPKPVAPVAPPADTGTAPSWKASLAMGKGRGHTFRLKTLEIAIAAGYKVTTEPPFDNVVLFEKGDTKFRATYTAQDFLSKVEGTVTIRHEQTGKWDTFNAALLEHATA